MCASVCQTDTPHTFLADSGHAPVAHAEADFPTDPARFGPTHRSIHTVASSVMSTHSATCIRGGGDSWASFSAWLGSARHHSEHHPPSCAFPLLGQCRDRRVVGTSRIGRYRTDWDGFVTLGKEGQKILVAGQKEITSVPPLSVKCDENSKPRLVEIHLAKSNERSRYFLQIPDTSATSEDCLASCRCLSLSSMSFWVPGRLERASTINVIGFVSRLGSGKLP